MPSFILVKLSLIAPAIKAMKDSRQARVFMCGVGSGVKYGEELGRHLRLILPLSRGPEDISTPTPVHSSCCYHLETAGAFPLSSRVKKEKVVKKKANGENYRRGNCGRRTLSRDLLKYILYSLYHIIQIVAPFPIFFQVVE